MQEENNLLSQIDLSRFELFKTHIFHICLSSLCLHNIHGNREVGHWNYIKLCLAENMYKQTKSIMEIEVFTSFKLILLRGRR